MFTLQSLEQHSPSSIANCLKLGFSDYFVPIAFDISFLMNMIRQHSVDWNSSLVAIQDEKPVGVALLARRGNESRLAAMTVVPEARKQGIGWKLLQEVIGQSRQRQDSKIWLEVIEQNEAAIQMYQKAGFQTLRRLVGFHRSSSPTTTPSSCTLEETSPYKTLSKPGAQQPSSIPWQCSPTTLLLSTPAPRTFENEAASIAVMQPTQNPNCFVILQLFVPPEQRRRGHGKELMTAMFQKYPDKEWRIPVVCPEEWTGFFTSLGFQKETLTQWQMLLELNGK